jgi:hypothetical protein
MQFPPPGDLTLKDWADQVTYVIAQHAEVRYLTDNDWQSWGMLFFTSPEFSKYIVPSPYAFEDWRDWAKELPSTGSTISPRVFYASQPTGQPPIGGGGGGTGGGGGGGGTTPTATFLITQSGVDIVTQIGYFLVTQ